MDKVKDSLLVGGYDNDFFDKILNRYLCKLCDKVLNEPCLLVCCGEHVCEKCLSRSWEDKHIEKCCPQCGTEEIKFQHVLDKGLETEILSLKVRCNNKQKGCKWMGPLEKLSSHLESDKGCAYVEIECSNRCTESDGFTVTKLRRKNLEQHLKKECYFRAHECKFCGYEDTYVGIEGHSEAKGHGTLKRSTNHYDICPEFPLECPNTCGVKDIKRKQLKDHCEKCPREKVPCPFKEAGCNERFIRRDIEKHVTTNQYQHMLLVMKSFEKMKCDFEDHKAKIMEMTKVMSIDVKLLRELSNLKLSHSALASIETHLGSCELTVYDSFVVFRMTDFPHYKATGQVWYSPPFYLCIPQLDNSTPSKYKMRLAVNASGVGPASGTHVSISLLLLSSEYDSQSKWPFDYGTESDGELTLQLVSQMTKSEVSMDPTDAIYCGLVLPHYQTEEVYQVETKWGHRVLVSVDKFVPHDLIDRGYLFEESILWKVLAPGILD